MESTVLLGISGGIAAVKIPELITQLTKRSITIETIETRSATKIVSPQEIASLTGRRVHLDMFDEHFSAKEILAKRHVKHIDLADSADLFVIVPATANAIAKLATGIADDYLTTTALAVTCPVVVCPSMNVHMWTHPSTQKNVQTLKTLGYHILGPDDGMLACGYSGTGRLIDIDTLVETITSFTSLTKPLAGKRALVTAGGTVEPIDDVRMITNKSSGKMGIEMAQALAWAGAEVILLRSKTSVPPRLAVKEERFDTADSLERLMNKYIPTVDICVHAAAVSDFSVKNNRVGKMSSDRPLALELEPRTKILDSIKRHNPKVFLIAFKAEANVSPKTLITLAKKRLLFAHADLIIANDIAKPNAGFGTDTNEVYIIKPNGSATHVPLTSKSIIAQRIVQFL